MKIQENHHGNMAKFFVYGNMKAENFGVENEN